MACLALMAAAARAVPARGRAAARAPCARVRARATAAEAGASAEEDTDALMASLTRINEHNAAVARPAPADDCRTLLATQKMGVLSTNASQGGALEGFPAGAVASFAAQADGLPVFALSSLSAHMRDLRADGRCSLVVAEDGAEGMNSARVTLIGTVEEVADEEEQAACREAYLARHPDAFWVDFGDFSWFKMRSVATVRLVGGFARAHTVSAEAYAAASPDPVSAFSGPVCAHMNDDHTDSTAAIVARASGVSVDAAKMLSIDRLGMDVECELGGERFNVRCAWESPAESRADIKARIVELSKLAATEAATEA